MPDKHISDLIKDESFLNYCFNRNEQDVLYWESWIAQRPDCKDDIEELKSVVILLANESREQELKQQFSILKDSIASRENVRPDGRIIPPSLFVKLAIAALLFLVCTVGILLYQNYQAGNPELAGRVGSEIVPGGNKAYLTLGDGTRISLTDARQGAIIEQAGMVISKSGDGEVIYTTSEAEQGLSSQMNTLQTPRGGQYQVRLPDGTAVWLNAASSLKYPTNFSALKERRVELTGEAYFEVAKDKMRPFIVQTAQQEVQVLGTHFNVKGYADEPVTTTTLIEGSVLIHSIASGQRSVLKPGEQANVLLSSGGIDVSNVNTGDVMAWKRGYFIFDNQDITSIMKVIGRWYDVDVEYKGMNKEERFGGTFSKTASLSEILSNLESLGKIRFTVKERRITVSSIY